MLKNARIWLFLIVTIVAVTGTGLVGFLGYVDTTRIIERLDRQQDWATRSVLASAGNDDPLLAKLYGALEFDTLEARNDRAAAQLATRTWLRFLTSIFGGILIVFGAAFVLGYVTAGPIEGTGGNGTLSISFKTTSPGLVMAALGVFLVSFPLWSTQEITTWDGASYGAFMMTEGPDGPVATLTPLAAAATIDVQLPSDEEIAKALAKPKENQP